MIAADMNEKDRGGRYEQMVPQELNAELIKVYRRIPKAEFPNLRGGIRSQEDLDRFVNFTNIVFSRAERRRRSQRKKHLVNIHSELIGRSHLTSFFQHRSNNTFSAQYDLGFSLDIQISRGLPESPYLQFNSRDLLDLGNPGSPGIFDKEKAKEIERKAYNAALSQRLYSRSRFDQLNIPGKEINEVIFESEDKGEWLNQFLQKHGELP